MSDVIKSLSTLQEDKTWTPPVPLSVDLINVLASQIIKDALQEAKITPTANNIDSVLEAIIKDLATKIDGGTNGVVAVANGGTGKTSITKGNVLVGGNDNTVVEVGVDTTVQEKSENFVTSGAVYDAIDKKADKNHASTINEYGLAEADYFGHVKLSDDYKTVLGDGTAVAVSQKATIDLYNELTQGSGNKNIVFSTDTITINYVDGKQEVIKFNGTIITDTLYSDASQATQLSKTTTTFTADGNISIVEE